MAVPLVKQAHNKVASYLIEGDRVVDATMGNGFDTLFLAGGVGERGKVYSFDLQVAALTKTKERLKEAHLLDRVRLIQDSHDRLSAYLAEDGVRSIRCAMFNLGYLPGGDKTVKTGSESTIKALDSVVAQIEERGIISILAYTGHAGGREEADAVRKWALELPRTAFRVTIEIPEAAKNSPPELILVETV